MSHILCAQKPCDYGFHIWPHRYRTFLSLQTVLLPSTAPLRDNQDKTCLKFVYLDTTRNPSLPGISHPHKTLLWLWEDFSNLTQSSIPTLEMTLPSGIPASDQQPPLTHSHDILNLLWTFSSSSWSYWKMAVLWGYFFALYLLPHTTALLTWGWGRYPLLPRCFQPTGKT